MGILLEV
jgi:RES domain-containing protein